MRILTIHNRYKFRGGEDESREAEDRILTEKGHIVRELTFDNSTIVGIGIAWAGLSALWNPVAYREVQRSIREFRPDIVDVHNFFPLASPSVHYAARDLNVPVVQTLHNFRLLCPNAMFFRSGSVCRECTGHSIPWPAVVHRCYHGSAAQTSAVALMISLHRVLRTWRRAVSLFVCVSEFSKRQFVESNGFPTSRIVVKPNCVRDPGLTSYGGKDFVFVGRLAIEKGVRAMLEAMEIARIPATLKIVGDGPLEGEVRAASARNPRIEYLGRQPQDAVLNLLARSKALIFPSECYETFGRVAAEAYACGTPVIASNIGAVAEIVDHGRTGFQYRPGDSRDLAKVMDYVSENPALVAGMRTEARREYELKYTPERNYDLMLSAYNRAIANP